MPSEWSHAAVRSLLTQHHYSMTKATVRAEVGKEGEDMQKGESNAQIEKNSGRERHRREINTNLYRREIQYYETAHNLIQSNRKSLR